MRTTFDNIFVAEGDLREYVTEDGLAYYPEFVVVVTIGNDIYENPYLFETENEASSFMETVKQFGTIDTDIWVKYNDKNSYTNGNEPYDEEELYYMNII